MRNGTKPGHRLIPGLLAPLLLAGALHGQQIEVEVYDLMVKGIEAYDAGDFETAVSRYSEALALTPENTLILYERAMAYLSTGEYDLCIRDAEAGLGRASTNEAGLFAMLGNCYSERGDGALAIDAYNEGLAGFPDSVQLNFNIAIALARNGEPALAREHLKTTLGLEPHYASANLLLGQLYQGEGYRVPAIYQYLRFLSTELQTERATVIARTTLDLIRDGIEGDDDGDIRVVLSPGEPGDEEGDFSNIENMLTITSAAGSIDPPADPRRTLADEAVSTVLTAVEITRNSSDEDVENSWPWAHAVSFVLALEEAGHLEAMSYIAFSALDGAREWIDENSGSVERFLIWRERMLETP